MLYNRPGRYGDGERGSGITELHGPVTAGLLSLRSRVLLTYVIVASNAQTFHIIFYMLMLMHPAPVLGVRVLVH